MSMLILACLLSALAMCLGRSGAGLRDAAVKAFMLICFAVAGLTEILSAAGLLRLPVLASMWLVLAVAAGGMAARRHPRQRWRCAVAASWGRLAGLSGAERLGLGFVGVILGVTLLIALLAPPNNWDSMTYHMARVAAWIQQGSVDFYPTNIGRQNYLTPLMEFMVLHLQILSGSDRLAGLVQWSSFTLCIVLASLVVKELKQGTDVQVFAAVLTATLPMGILQSSSTQNDLVCGVLCLAFAYYLLKLSSEFSFENAVFCGLSLGLALLAKGTAYVFCPAIALPLGGLVLARADRATWRQMPGRVAAITLIALAINCGHWARSYALYGTPLSSGTEPYRNERVSGPIVAANVVRNMALHLGVPWPAVNRATAHSLAACLGEEAANPASTWAGARFHVRYAQHEDLAGNFVHLLLIIAALGGVLWGAGEGKRERILWASTVVAGVLLFSALFKWQPWSSRLHTPLFLLAMPVAAIVLAGERGRRSLVLAVGGTALFLLCLPFLLYNETRPLLAPPGRSVLTAPRAAQYFASRPELREAYAGAVHAALAGHPAEIGLMIGGDDWEYPFWVLAGKEATPGIPVFRHVDSLDDSAALESRQGVPAVIIATRRPRRTDLRGNGYRMIYGAGPVGVLARPAEAVAAGTERNER